MFTLQYKKQLETMQAKNAFKGKIPAYEEIYNFVSNVTPHSILDYGCAHGTLINKLKEDFPEILVVDGYDPGVKEYENFPNRKYEVLISNDVLEHVEPEFLDMTLKRIEKLFTKNARLIIACYPAKKILPDGRNAHLIVESTDWWLDKIRATMLDSTVLESKVKVLNPDSDKYRKSKTGVKELMVKKGEQIELHVILGKTNGTT